MADFYVLPPRPTVGEEIARLLRPYLPGLPISAADGARCLDLVFAGVTNRAYLLHREDLPEGIELVEAIRDGFGAGAGDRIVQVAISGRDAEPRVQTHALPHHSAPERAIARHGSLQ